jgi:hypothetical protein
MVPPQTDYTEPKARALNRVGVLIAGGRHQGGRGMTSNQNAKNKKPDARAGFFVVAEGEPTPH